MNHVISTKDNFLGRLDPLLGFAHVLEFSFCQMLQIVGH